jgi:hypothetical protein
MQSLPSKLTKADALTLLLEHHNVTKKQLEKLQTSLNSEDNTDERTVLQAVYE